MLENLVIHIINYIYFLGGIAFVLERLFSKKKGEAIVLKLIDWSQYLSAHEFDNLVKRISSYFSQLYDKIYGKKYFGKKEWVISSIIAFSYCYFFYLAEKMIGFETTLAKQLGYWFLPNLIADILSINFTRWILKRLYENPSRYILYLLYDISMLIICFYICFSFTIIYLLVFSDLHVARIVIHPLHLISIIMSDFPDPLAIDSLFILIMASSTFIPTLLHLFYLIGAFLAKMFIPYLKALVLSLVERIDSFEYHPVGAIVIVSGMFLLPFVIMFKLFLML